MIPIPTGVRVWLASGQTDKRNYVERRIMRSPLWLSRACIIEINVLVVIDQAFHTA